MRDQPSAGDAARPVSTMRRPRAPILISSSAERNAPSDSTAMPSRAVRRKSLQAQSGSRTRSPKKQAQAEAVGACIGQAQGRVGTLQAVADHDVGPRLIQPAQEAPDVGYPELAIAVGEADERVARGSQPGTDGGPVAQVARVMDDPHDVGVRCGEPVGDGPGPVAAAVVDADDLEPVGQRRQRRERLLDEPLDVLGLVVRREEVAQLRDARVSGVEGERRRGSRRAAGVVGTAAGVVDTPRIVPASAPRLRPARGASISRAID